ncbi:MAG: ERF family protein [Pseudomonadota bacterium]|nr:ERF family protein [Pseudomonadota bacterium]
MTETTVKPNIYQRVNAVQKKVDYLKKAKEVQNYKAITHDQVTAFVRDHLVANGILIIPHLVTTSTHDAGLTAKGNMTIRVEVEYDFKFVNIDDPSDYFVSKVSAHALDTGDKAPGKALSYAKKAMMLKVFEIETGEDDESRYAEATQSAKDVPENELADLIASISECADLESLKKAYTNAVKVAGSDKGAVSAIIKAKDTRKAQLTEKVAA